MSSSRVPWRRSCLDLRSDPPGSRHDTYCLGDSELLVTLDPNNWIGDKGYVGNNMLTPIKKPACRDLLDWEKEFNKQINKIRYVIEQVIAISRPGESCTPTIADPLRRLCQPSQR
ncbi:MAG TPA: transposase family protein [Gammaproteobacteria bacterium]|nr:transposase family protein [Gammaproteobacteria bacterium]